VHKEEEMTVQFKFEIDQKVKAEKLGVTGVVTMCAVNSGSGLAYYVSTGTERGSDWFNEGLLADAEDNK
jgi:hypothetical protein